MGDPTQATDNYWGDLMAASGELRWPSAGRFVSAYGENLMAADNLCRVGRKTIKGGCRPAL